MRRTALLMPPLPEAVAGELTGVVAGAQGDVAGISAHVVQAVRNHHAAVARAMKIMVQRLDQARGPDAAWTVEVAQILLLLRVHADHRLPGRQVLLFQFGDVAELLVAMLITSQRHVLLSLPPVIAEGLQQVLGRVPTNGRAPRRQFVGDLTWRQRRPDDFFAHRISCRELGDNLDKVVLQRRRAFKTALAAPLFAARVRRLCPPAAGRCLPVPGEWYRCYIPAPPPRTAFLHAPVSPLPRRHNGVDPSRTTIHRSSSSAARSARDTLPKP